MGATLQLKISLSLLELRTELKRMIKSIVVQTRLNEPPTVFVNLPTVLASLLILPLVIMGKFFLFASIISGLFFLIAEEITTIVAFLTLFFFF